MTAPERVAAAQAKVAAVMASQRIIADRAEHECCERSTPGCSINHTAERALYDTNWRDYESTTCQGW